MPSGGDWKEITWNHPTLGSGRFLLKSGTDITVMLGGYTTSDSDDNIDSGGNFINTKQLKPWSATIESAAWDMINPQRRELEQLQAMSNSFDLATWTFTNINNVTYSGSGTVAGDLQGSGKNSTVPFKVMGGGILQKIG